MDLTIAGVTAYQQAQTASQVQTDVAAKVLNLAREQGASALQLLQNATSGAQPGDALTAAATGLGGQVDTFA
ncbi:MAG TPA: hypothetical protein VFE47_14340 [Tepidisphaeraceae bacterium]|jgi:hypothetical protein|nr:hypothetical protein [Tepidisphaeraceae bacterium]